MDSVLANSIKPRLPGLSSNAKQSIPRDCSVCLEDILASIKKARSYTGGLSKGASFQDDKIFDAVVRNLEVIGEATKNIPEDDRVKYPGVEWRKIAGLRDILIHEYF